MKSFATSDFWKYYCDLTPGMKLQAQKAYQLLKENPLHPSLHFKKVGKDLWAVRITGGYRALALNKGRDYYWIWIGSHEQYETKLK